jgi:hypothetical protein
MDNKLILRPSSGSTRKLQLKNLWTVSRKLILRAVNYLFGSPPTVITTDPVTNISSYSATGGGNVTDDGGWPYTERGICWDTSINPTILYYVQMDTSFGEGTYTCVMNNLEPSTLYYIRALAANTRGLTYGQDVSFYTLPVTGGDSALYVGIGTIYGTTDTTSIVVAYVTYTGSITPVYRGACWSSSTTMPTVTDSSIRDTSTGAGTYYNYLSGLTPDTTYYVRAFAYNNAQLVYSYNQPFTTAAAYPQTTAPGVSTLSPYNVSTGSATLGGYVYSEGNAPPVYRGVCYGLYSSPTINDASALDYATGLSNYFITVSGLNPSTYYYTRAFAWNSIGLSYGSNYTFTTSTSTGSISLPSVVVVDVTDISTSSAKFTGNVTSTGGATTYRGACWSAEHGYPTIADSSIQSGSTGSGYYDVSITGLDCSTTYAVRAFAWNSAGIIYGSKPPASIYSFNTPACSLITSAPVVETVSVVNIGYTEASVNGNVTHDGSIATVYKGICWATHVDPNRSTDNHTVTSGGEGAFTHKAIYLSPGTLYHTRAYAYNTVGTSYGIDISFNTLTSSYTAPTVITSPATNVLATSATTGGNVTHDGYVTLTYRGICISTSANPTVLDTSIRHAETGEGVYACQFSNLTSNTTYYSRAFAYNSEGISYGADASFYTLLTSPEIKSIHEGYYQDTATYYIPTNASAGDFIIGVLTTKKDAQWLSLHNNTTANFNIALRQTMSNPIILYDTPMRSILYYGISTGINDNLTIKSTMYDEDGTAFSSDARSLTYVIKNHNVNSVDPTDHQFNWNCTAGYGIFTPVGGEHSVTELYSDYLAAKTIKGANQLSPSLYIRFLSHNTTAVMISHNSWVVQPTAGFSLNAYNMRTAYWNVGEGQASIAGCSRITTDTSVSANYWNVKVDFDKDKCYVTDDGNLVNEGYNIYIDICFTIG